MPPPTYDGITELRFEDVQALGRRVSDPQYLAVIRPDEESVLNLHGRDFTVSEENVVFD